MNKVKVMEYLFAAKESLLGRPGHFRYHNRGCLVEDDPDYMGPCTAGCTNEAITKIDVKVAINKIDNALDEIIDG